MNRTSTVIGVAIIIASSMQVSVASEVTAKPLALRKIMQDLGENMQTITDGISREDWKLIQITSVKIADHPKPSFSEKFQILRFVGSDVSKFKSYDGKTHDAAIQLEEAAIQQDGQAVIQVFSVLQKSCMDCHQTFRKPFLEKFYHSSSSTLHD